jgi:hypothetical protein
MKLAAIGALCVILSVPSGIALAAESGADAGAGSDRSLAEGDTFMFAGGKAKVTKIETTPVQDTNYSQRFHFDRWDNPKLAALRERYKLEQIVAAGRDEFDEQIILMDWVHHKFKKFGQPSSPAKGALDILKAVENGHTFFCSHFAHVLVSCAASIGWIDRELALRRHQGVAKGGSSEHSTTEIWSNQYRKWVMLDPTSNMYLEKDGIPLNAFEIRQEWFYRHGTDLVLVVGKERRKYQKADLPIVLGSYQGFGNLTIDPDELDKYGFIGYIPNTNLMDAGEDYGKMFIVKDRLCAGTKWHVRDLPENPQSDPYFPINQASVTLSLKKQKPWISVQTLTPNFDRFEMKANEAAWQAVPAEFAWQLRPGDNRITIRAVNKFRVPGPVSVVQVALPP